MVSNRLPVSLARQGDEWQTQRSAGGLATAVDPILKRARGVWIGWSGAREKESAEALELLRQEGCVAVDLPVDIAEKFYEGYSNRCLWPLFHNFASKLQFDPRLGKHTSKRIGGSALQSSISLTLAIASGFTITI